jgi:hypothetical protein
MKFEPLNLSGRRRHFRLVVAITPAFVSGQLAPKSSAVRNLEPGGMSMPQLRRYCNSLGIFTARHTKNEVDTNVRTASRAIGGCYGIRGFGSAFFGGSVPCKRNPSFHRATP